MIKIDRNPQNLCPWFAERLQNALAECQSLGFRISVFEGYRSPERQQELYDQGRFTRGKIVTHSKPFQSWHQFGLAADIAYRTPEGNWTWDSDFIRLAPIFQSHHLKWFGPRDAGHYECPASSLQTARTLLESDGLEGVWADALKRGSHQA